MQPDDQERRHMATRSQRLQMVTRASFFQSSSSDLEASQGTDDEVSTYESYDKSTASDDVIGCDRGNNQEVQEQQEAPVGPTGDDAASLQETARERAESSPQAPSQVPLRVWCGEHLFARRKIVQTKHYFCCTVKGCKAGFVYNSETGISKTNGKEHNHDTGMVDNIVQKNAEEIAFREFVRDHIHLDSRSIYSLILRRNPEEGHFPPLESITVKRIDNVKGQITGTPARQILNSLLPPSLAQIDGQSFLALQTVKPLALVFATGDSLGRLRGASESVLLKVRAKGQDLTDVFCVYAKEGDRIVPTVWLLFNSDADFLPWVHLKWLLSHKASGDSLSRMWNVPGAPKYIECLSHAMRQNDFIRAIGASYDWHIAKQVDKLDESHKEAMLSMSREMMVSPIHGVREKLHQLEQTWQGVEDVQMFLQWWKRRFEQHVLFYHASNLCREPSVEACYLSNKQTTPLECTTDEELIAFVQQQYREAYPSAK